MLAAPRLSLRLGSSRAGRGRRTGERSV